MASKKHPKAKPFKNKSFPLFDNIGDLVDGTRATGEYVFQGGQSPTQSNESTLAPISYDGQIDLILLQESKNDWESDNEDTRVSPPSSGPRPH